MNKLLHGKGVWRRMDSVAVIFNYRDSRSAVHLIMGLSGAESLAGNTFIVVAVTDGAGSVRSGRRICL